jgi:hypothetical protein
MTLSTDFALRHRRGQFRGLPPGGGDHIRTPCALGNHNHSFEGRDEISCSSGVVAGPPKAGRKRPFVPSMQERTIR